MNFTLLFEDCMNNRHGLIILVLACLSLTGCQTYSPPSFTPGYEIESHPLVDKIWSTTEAKFITADTLKAETLKHQAILLGETHDNARHHQLQAELLQHLLNHQRQPGVAFEMLNRNQQDIIDQFQKAHRNIEDKTDSFAEVVQWQASGWPEWPYYRPVFYAAIENDLPVIAANQDRATIRKVITKGSGTLPQNYQDLLTKYQYDDTLQSKLEQDIGAAHCDMLPEKMFSPMLMGQQVKDLSMTLALFSSLTGNNARKSVVLIAGSGHTRNDYGVPYYLQQEAPHLETLSIAFMEVRKDKFQPGDYSRPWGTEQLPFDYVWFTPRAQREDQCEKLKAHMKKKTKT